MIFLLKDPENIKLTAACIVVDVYLLLVIANLVTAFFMQLQYNPYSYNIIYYSGFSLFLLSVLISHIAVTISVLSFPDAHGIWSIPFVLAGSARNYMLVSAPFVLVFSVALFISNISLIRHEGKRFVNYLGMLLAVLMVAGELFLFLADNYTSGSWTQVFIHDLFINIFAALYLYFECMVIGAIIANSIAAKHEPEKDKDFIIILGCSLRKDGTPTPLLAGRIERALGFYRAQIEQTGKVPVLISSGGQGNDERHSESAAMTDYLIGHGVPAEHIMMEDQSRNTFENMLFSKGMIMERCHDADEILSNGKIPVNDPDAEKAFLEEKIRLLKPSAKIAFSTTNYHVFRSGLMARRVKMRAIGMGSKTKWYFWPNAAVREFAGLLQQHKGKQAIIIICMIAAYVLLTIWNMQY